MNNGNVYGINGGESLVVCYYLHGGAVKKENGCYRHWLGVGKMLLVSMDLVKAVDLDFCSGLIGRG